MGEKRKKCIDCERPAKSNGISIYGVKKWKKYCDFHYRRKTIPGKKRHAKKLEAFKLNPYGDEYRNFKKSSCESCGFIPVHKCQLDVDHIDGNHKNNNPENLKTLCANCHRIKTFIQRYGQGAKN